MLVNVRDYGWDTAQYLSEVLVTGIEEFEREDQRSILDGVDSSMPFIALRCSARCRRCVSCLPSTRFGRRCRAVLLPSPQC